MRTLFVVICVCCPQMLAGCTGSVAPSKLEPPASVLMVPPAKLPDVKEGDDLVLKHIELRRAYASVSDRHKRLQRYINTILGR